MDKYEHIHWATNARLAELIRSIGTDPTLTNGEIEEIHEESAIRLEAFDNRPIKFNNEQFE